MYMCMYVHVCMCIHMYMYVYMHIYCDFLSYTPDVCMYLCMHAWNEVCPYACSSPCILHVLSQRVGPLRSRSYSQGPGLRAGERRGSQRGLEALVLPSPEVGLWQLRA